MLRISISRALPLLALTVACSASPESVGSDGPPPSAGGGAKDAGKETVPTPDAGWSFDSSANPDQPTAKCAPDLTATPDLVVFDVAGDYTIANGKAFQIPMNAYGVDIYVIGGGGSSDTFHDTPSDMDNHSVTWGTPGATVKRSLDRDQGNLKPGQKWEFSIGAGAPDPQNTGMCTVVASNLGQRGAASALFDPAAPGSGQVLLEAAGGGRGSYCSEHGTAWPVGPGSCLSGAIDECYSDQVAPSDSQYDPGTGDELWGVQAHVVDCQGVGTSVAVQPDGDAPGCGPGAAMVPGKNYNGLVSARDGGVAFRITPCAKESPN